MKNNDINALQSQFEQHLIESKQLFKIVFENSPAAIMVADAQERVVAWNSMAEKMLGMFKKDLFNKQVSSLYPAEEWKRIRSLNIRRKGMHVNLATKAVRRDGTHYHLATPRTEKIAADFLARLESMMEEEIESVFW